MTIAIILPPREGFSPQSFGAVSLSVRDFCLHSRYRGQTVVLGGVNAPSFADIRYECLPVRRHWWERHTSAYVRAIAQRLATLKPALIEIHNRPMLAQKLAPLVNIPIALHLHNDPQEMKAAKTPVERAALLDKCAAVYCISDWVRSRFIEGVSKGHEKLPVIHCGIEIPPPPSYKKQQILYAGRMTPNKGALEFAQALSRLLPTYKNWTGVMIGGRRHSISAKLSKYEKQIVELMDETGRNAHFEGFTPHAETMQTFAESAIVVIPSLWEEPFGRTALEALAQGCAVITSGRGGLKEIVGDAGIVLGDVTEDSIASAIETLILSDERLATLQKLAYAQASRFEVHRCSQVLDAVRDNLLSGRARRAA